MNLDHPAGIRAEHENLPVFSEDVESNPVHDDNDAELGHIMIPSLTSRILLYGALTETSHLPLWISAPLDRHVPGVVESTLRGVSQVVLINNPTTGVFFVVALFIGGGAWLGVLALASTFITTWLCSKTFADIAMVKNGLAGYNATLVGCAFAVFFGGAEWNFGALVAAVFGACVSAFLNMALKAGLGALPTFTLAFNFVALAGLAQAPPFATGDNGSDGPAPELAGAGDVFLGALVGVSQVFVVNSPIAAAIILAGMALESRGIALAAFTCSLVGSAVGAAIGADKGSIADGLFGFNAALIGCSTAVFFVPSWASTGLALLTSAATAVLGSGLGRAFGSAFGIPSGTLPFCIAASVCHLLLSDGAIRGLVGAIIPVGPEMNYVNFMRNALLESEIESKKAELGIAPAAEPVVDENARVFYGPSAVSLVAKEDTNVLDRAPTSGSPASSEEVQDSLARPRRRHSVMVPTQQAQADAGYSLARPRKRHSVVVPTQHAQAGLENVPAANEATTMDLMHEATHIVRQLESSGGAWLSRRSNMRLEPSGAASHQRRNSMPGGELTQDLAAVSAIHSGRFILPPIADPGS